jgi:hypothetical protein
MKKIFVISQRIDQIMMRLRHSWRKFLAALCLLCLLGIIYLIAAPPTLRGTISGAQPESGHAWRYEIPRPPLPTRLLYDHWGYSGKDLLKLFQDGIELGPSEALHDDIRTIGAGRFSHWDNAIYFSSLNNAGSLKDIIISYDLELKPRKRLFLSAVFFAVATSALSLAPTFRSLCNSCGILYKWTGYACLMLGLGLLFINFIGLFVNFSYVPPKAGKVPPADVTPIVQELYKKDGEALEQYLERLTDAVYRNTTHYFIDRKSENSWKVRSRGTVELTENWSLYLYALWKYLLGEWHTIEFSEPEPALRRGYGYCSQRALIAAAMLERQQMPGKMSGLEGHVVAMTTLPDGREYILDPDYNIVIPYSLNYITDSMRIDLFTTYYTGKNKFDIFQLYKTKENNKIYESPYLYTGEYIENLYSIAKKIKWIIPILCIISGIILIFIYKYLLIKRKLLCKR